MSVVDSSIELYIGRRRLRPFSRLAIKKSIILGGRQYQDSNDVKIIMPREYKLKYPWMRLESLVQIDIIFEGQVLVPGPIDDNLYDRLIEAYT